MIIALAGRLIDAHDATVPRFPLGNSATVRQSIRRLFLERKATALICSAACGADLLALDAAGELGLQRHIILPFEKQRFRATSVVNRPGDWGVLFDRIIDEVEAAEGLMILNQVSEDDAVYSATNSVILDEAELLAYQHSYSQAESSVNSILAVIVWEGKIHNQEDFTADFASLADKRSIPIVEIATI